MVREKRILSYILGWFIVGYIILFIGINNVNANTIDYENIGMLSDYTLFYSQDTNSNPEFSQLTQYEYYNLMNVTAFLVGINTFEFKSGVIYDLEVYMPANSLKNNANFIVTDANYNQCTTYELFIEDEHYPRFRFSCPSDTIGLDLYIYNDSEDYVINNGNFSWHYTYLRKQVSTVDLGPIIDQNNQIIQGQEDIKDAIIDSNKETQDIIKDQFNSCRDSYNLLQYSTTTDTTINGVDFKFNSDGSITANGTATDNTRFDFVSSSSVILSSGQYTFSGSLGGSLNTYFMETIIAPSYIYFHSFNGPETISLSDGSYILKSYIYIKSGVSVNNVTFKPMFEKGTISHAFEPYGEKICSNKIDETNKELGNINDALTDQSSPNLDGLANSAGWLPPGPLDSVLNLPLSLFNSLTTNLNKSCSPVSLPLPYVNKNLTIPCINILYENIGISTFINWLGVIVSGLMLYTYLLKLYKWIEDRISLNETHSVDNWGGL